MFATTIFTLLPGIITSSVIINIAPFVITLSRSNIYWYHTQKGGRYWRYYPWL